MPRGAGTTASAATRIDQGAPYGRELTGYETPDLEATLTKAKSAGARVLVEPYSADDRRSALVQFPGGYIAEIHSTLRK